jgi:ferric-dicitrate binding protein FerR (iron transport regulator)
MQYEEYKVEDFLTDEFFVRWVKNPGPETEHFWKSWIEKNPDKVPAIVEAKEIVDSINYKNRFSPSKQEYNEVLENIVKHQSSWTQLGYTQRKDRLTFLVKYAALFLLFLCFSALMLYLNENQSKEQQVIRMIEAQNPDGVKTTFDLADGTIVKLNAGSKLTYPEEFSDESRLVSLEGEAFFIVTHDEKRPFIVNTADLTSMVLGTSFNVNSYFDHGQTTVSVASGQVGVRKNNGVSRLNGAYFLLKQNQMLTYNSIENMIVEQDSVPAEVFAWKDNTIIFNHTPFNKIVSKLQRWYGVQFEVENEKVFTGRFTGTYINQDLNIVLEGLKDQYDFEFYIDRDNKTVYLN